MFVAVLMFVVYTETHWQVINSYNCCQAVTRETFPVTPVVVLFLGKLAISIWQKKKKRLVDKAVVSMYEVLKLGRKHNLSIKCLLSLFDKMVKPILLYGCEIWGFGNNDRLKLPVLLKIIPR
jgi:hypothetical protein